MPNFTESRRLPYGAEKLYELVADVESYPAFVPGWVEARVRESRTNYALVDQSIGVGALNARFSSEATFDPPVAMRVVSHDGPFQSLIIEWRFEPAGPAQCTVHLDMRFELRSGALDRLAGMALATLAPHVMDAFERRARLCLGT